MARTRPVRLVVAAVASAIAVAAVPLATASGATGNAASNRASLDGATWSGTITWTAQASGDYLTDTYPGTIATHVERDEIATYTLDGTATADGLALARMAGSATGSITNENPSGECLISDANPWYAWSYNGPAEVTIYYFDGSFDIEPIPVNVPTSTVETGCGLPDRPQPPGLAGVPGYGGFVLSVPRFVMSENAPANARALSGSTTVPWIVKAPAGDFQIGTVTMAWNLTMRSATYPETAGGAAHTWTNYANAGGTQGPTIPAFTTVQIACKVTGFQVADGNTWWYQIAQSPWSNQYYVSADAFYNNGATWGSLHGTPFVDLNVPDCASSASPPAATGTFSETASIHHVVHTFADYHNASGQGPDIGMSQIVQVSCKVYDPTIVSVNPDGYWYRIASSPWNNNYYAPANTFLDGDPPNGPYTHNTDFSVPDCGSSGGSPTSPSVTLAKGPAAPFGYRYAVSLSGFSANVSVAISCRDSVDPGGFFNFDMKTNGSGSAFVENECYSADGPDHWVVADGAYVSNHVQWGSGVSAPPPTSTASNPPSVGSPAAPPHLWIVTLGDSYTAGNGAGANYDSPCHRSYNSYPWLYMNLLRGAGYSADIWQAACSGAIASQVTGQIANVLKSPASNQANLVFLTIGGNDLSFRPIVEGCLLPYTSLLTQSSCSSLIDSALNLFPTVIDNTRSVLKNIAGAMPHAQIVLVGYPPLTSPKCPGTPWNQTIAEAQSTFDTEQSTMVTKLNRADATTRFHFLSIAQTFSGHGPCAAAATQYVRGVDLQLPGFDDWPSYHPNLTGDQVIANLLYAARIQNQVGPG